MKSVSKRIARPTESSPTYLSARLALHGVICAAEHAASREDIMSVQPLRKEGDRNPRTADEAKALVK
jgi:hypothetical protein